MKKRAKKSNRKNSYYTEGRNMFGDKAETHFIVLEKETALSQIINAVCQLDGSDKEFTIDSSCFNDCPEEGEKVWHKVDEFMEFRARLLNQEFVKMDIA